MITAITYNRQFEITPTVPSTPSLGDGAITDKGITSRSFARKRNAYGMNMGDILLPEGETVAALVQKGLTNILRSKGYRVQDTGQTVSGNALQIEFDIKQFWCWMEPGDGI